jgi:beta-glucanase (GH16 family)
MRPRRFLPVFVALLAACLAGLPPALANPPGGVTAVPICGPGPNPVKANGKHWKCAFDDEFNGTTLNPSLWLPLTTAMNGVKAGAGCFVDDPDNIGVSDGALHLTVRQESAPVLCQSPKKGGSFYTYVTAGQVTTSGKFAQAYGKFSIRARFPAATTGGIHSALWLWPQNAYGSGLLGEIDLAEVYSALNDRAVPYLHYPMAKQAVDPKTDTNIFTNNYCLINDVTQYHNYTLRWTPTTLTIIYDDQTCLVDNVAPLGPSPFKQPYFVTLTESLGVGTNAPTFQTPLPSTMDIDWVRVWK